MSFLHKVKSVPLSLIVFLLLMMLSRLSSQITIAILDFEGKGISETEASALTDRFRAELFNLGRFRLIEREQMNEILREQGFQQTGCVTTECAVEVGKLIGSEQIVVGSISKVGKVFSVSGRVVDVETGEVLQVTIYDHEGEIGNLLKTGMKNVAVQLTSPQTQGVTPKELSRTSLDRANKTWSAHVGLGSKRALNLFGITKDFRIGKNTLTFVTVGFGTAFIGAGFAFEPHYNAKGISLSATIGITFGGPSLNGALTYQWQVGNRGFVSWGLMGGFVTEFDVYDVPYIFPTVSYDIRF